MASTNPRTPCHGAARGVFVDLLNVGRRLISRRVARTVIMTVAMPVALWWLEPWKLFITATIDEALPPGAQITCSGEFTSHIHQTSGSARLLTLPDGSRILRVENLHATQGPQLRVWLTNARGANNASRCRKFSRGNHIDLGPLRANRGNANYAIRGDADITGVSNVILWCDRFGVCFGAAQLHPLIR